MLKESVRRSSAEPLSRAIPDRLSSSGPLKVTTACSFHILWGMHSTEKLSQCSHAFIAGTLGLGHSFSKTRQRADELLTISRFPEQHKTLQPYAECNIFQDNFSIDWCRYRSITLGKRTPSKQPHACDPSHLRDMRLCTTPMHT